MGIKVIYTNEKGAGDQFAAHDVNAGVGSAAQHVVQRKDRQETGQNQHGMG